MTSATCGHSVCRPSGAPALNEALSPTAHAVGYSLAALRACQKALTRKYGSAIP